jgi:hypothetical protein
VARGIREDDLLAFVGQLPGSRSAVRSRDRSGGSCGVTPQLDELPHLTERDNKSMESDITGLGHLPDTSVAVAVKYSSAEHLLEDSHGLMRPADLKALLCDLQAWAVARLAEAPETPDAQAPSRQVRRQLERERRKAFGNAQKKAHHGPAFTRAMVFLGELTLGQLMASDVAGLLALGTNDADIRGFLTFIRDDATAKIAELDGQYTYQVSHMYLLAAQGLAEEDPDCPGCCWRLTEKGAAFASGKSSASSEVAIGPTGAVLGVAGTSRIVGGDLDCNHGDQ